MLEAEQSAGAKAQPESRQPTAQELFWAGAFGTDYTERNAVPWQARQPFFAHIFQLAPHIASVCELGANRGHNLRAIQAIQPQCALTGVEINSSALAHLQQQTGITAIRSAVQDFSPDQRFDLVMTCGLLIHLSPADLPELYRRLLSLSARYVLINEYYNPTPQALSYRGHQEKLFRRDFGGEFLDSAESQVRVAGYGFLWQRLEPAWDNTTWWLFEKRL